MKSFKSSLFYFQLNIAYRSYGLKVNALFVGNVHLERSYTIMFHG